MKFLKSALLLLLLINNQYEQTDAFLNQSYFGSKTIQKWNNANDGTTSSLTFQQRTLLDTSTTTTTTELFAKKKKKSPASAALEALEENIAMYDDDEDEGLSKKEMMKKMKGGNKGKKQAEPAADTNGAASAPAAQSKAAARAAALLALEEMEAANSSASTSVGDDPYAGMSKKERKLAEREEEKKRQKEEARAAKKAAKQAEGDAVEASVTGTNGEEASSAPQSKAAARAAALLALEALEAEQDSASSGEDPYAGMSKKERKLAEREAEKNRKKEEAIAAKKAAKQLEESNDVAPTNGEAVASAAPPAVKKEVTLEERLRKDRPPPRIRVMEGVQPGYVSLRLENVGVTFRNQEVLKSVTWGVQSGDRIGLVGANGGGKTTQLRILAGEMDPTFGDVVKSKKDLRVAVLRQEFVDELDPERLLKDEFLSVFKEEYQILEDLKAAEHELENVGEDTERMQEILDSMGELQAKADAKEVYNLDSRVEKVMNLMGFEADEAEAKVRMFSGGWKMRIGLGKVLLKDPNILLLDEPTNHLDLESVEWLENFLRAQSIPMVIVSHDREFLDQVCTKIVDTEGGQAFEYDGNYTRFLQLKKARMDAWNSAYKAQEKKIKEERQWINKFKAKQPDAVKQREAKLKKFMASEDFVQKPPFNGKPFRFRFPEPPRIGAEIAEIRNLSHGYGNGLNPLFDDVSLQIQKLDRIALIGPNGAGKSTILRILMGKEEADEGFAGILGSNVVANYFEQNQADVLDLEMTVSETVQAASSTESYNELRALLGQFMFKGDTVEKKVKNLSGGEKARLSLCCMMLKPSNLLVLDEPTNHLDIPAKEMLEEALQNFEGSLLLISHDRYFVSQVATTVVAIEDKKLVQYPGDYKYYMDQKQELKSRITNRYVGDFRIENAKTVDFDEMNKKTGNFGGSKNANLVTRKNKGIKNAKRNAIQ